MKIAVSGKGGVGKTTVTALLAHTYVARQRQVLAVDSDPSPSLAGALGVPAELRDRLRPIAEMEDLIEERTGARPGASGGFFSLNPRVDDLPERLSVVHEGVRLLEMGTVESGGSGCICPESALLKTLFTHLLFREDDILLLDMYAGVEHLGRSTADFVDVMLIVAEPTRRSLATARQIEGLARDVGLDRLFLIGNRVAGDDDRRFLEQEAEGPEVIGYLPEDPGVVTADRTGVPVWETAQRALAAVGEIADSLDRQEALR